MLSQTAGGRAAGLLSLCVVEIIGESKAGYVLYELSGRILPAERNLSSMDQLSSVARLLASKLGAVGFGSHLAECVTKVRMAYHAAGHEYPRDLLQEISAQSLVDYLHGISRALREELAVLYISGGRGIVILFAIAMALCPDDTTITVDDEIIFQGLRQSIFIQITDKAYTEFRVERKIYGKPLTDEHGELTFIKQDRPLMERIRMS